MVLKTGCSQVILSINVVYHISGTLAGLYTSITAVGLSWEVRRMKKRDFFVIISIVVLPYCSLLCTFGIAGIPEALSTKAGLGGLAHFDASPRRQSSDTTPYKVGEERSHAENKPFLLSVDKAVFACSEAACDNYYRQCGLDIDYTLYSEQARTAVREAVVSCRAKIVYQTKGGYRLNSEAGPETSRHTLKDKPEYSAQVSLHFHFSEYERVIEVQLDKIQCRVHSGDYVSRVREALID